MLTKDQMKTVFAVVMSETEGYPVAAVEDEKTLDFLISFWGRDEDDMDRFVVGFVDGGDAHEWLEDIAAQTGWGGDKLERLLDGFCSLTED